MLQKILKGLGIALIFMILLLAAAGIWVYKNQEELFVRIQTVVNDHINGELKVREYGFAPLQGGLGVTFRLEGISLHDDRYATYKTDLLKADRLLVTLDIRKLFSGKVVVRTIRIDNGELFIFKTKEGFSNLSLFKSEKKMASGEKSPPEADFLKNIKNVVLTNFKMTIIDSLTNKTVQTEIPHLANYISSSDTALNLDLEGQVLFKKMVFKAQQGSFLENKNTLLNLHLSFDDRSSILHIRPSDLQTERKEVIGISGAINFAEQPGNLNLTFTCNNIKVASALELLTQHLQTKLGRFSKNARATAKVSISNVFKSKKTRVNVEFRADSLEYALKLGNIKNVSATGFFTNQSKILFPPSDSNSRVAITGIKGFFESLPLTGNLIVDNMRNPSAVLDCQVKGDKSSLNGLLDPKRYKITGGEIVLDVSYKGPLKEFYNYQKNKMSGALKGKVALNSLAMTYVPQKVSISQIKGDVAFDNEVVNMPDVHFFDGENRVFLSGKMNGFFQHFFEQEMPLVASLMVKIPDWKLNWIGKFINNSPNKIKKGRPTKVRLSDLLDDAIDNIQIDATLDANTLKYKSLLATKVKGKMNLTAGNLVLDNFSMNACGGSVKISGGINFQNSKFAPQFYARCKLENADVKSVFASMENFGQDAITDKNIAGKLTSEFYFNSLLANNVSLIPSTMNGKIKVKLNHAEIINFEPFLKIKKLLFKRRNLEHVKFDLVEKEFILKGEEIKIEKMQVESNVLTLFVDGIYSFGNKTDISIQIPLSNLKKRDESYEFKVYDPDSVGRSIYLKAVDDEKGKVSIKLDLSPQKRRKRFKGFRRDSTAVSGERIKQEVAVEEDNQ